MTTNETLQFPVGQPKGNDADAHARRGARAPDLADDLVVHFGAGLDALGASETASLRRWVAGWLAREPDAIVVMACAAPAARAGRVNRLRMLHSVLSRLGVATQSVRYTDDLIEVEMPAADAADAAAEASGTAILKLLSARRIEREVRSIRSYFPKAARTKGVACTNAS